MKPKPIRQGLEYYNVNLEGGVPYLIHPDGEITLNEDELKIRTLKYQIASIRLRRLQILLVMIILLIAILKWR